jgi:hypothetical protein
LQAIADARSLSIKGESYTETTCAIKSEAKGFANPELGLSFENITDIFIAKFAIA